MNADSIFDRAFLALAMQDFNFYKGILTAIFVASVVLFFTTRYILGRQVEIHGDFWEHQKLAKSKILWLNALFITMLILICLCAFSLFQIIFLDFAVGYYINRLIALKFSFILSGIFALSILLAYFYQSIKMQNGGIDKLALALNATEISSPQNKQEQMLLNVIEEMAIASNMPMPRVFIMHNEMGVNAMCSGERFGKTNECVAIFVTQGALDNFTRDELQGVIGHEFSHAFHGDVALNLKIFSLIFGLTFTMIIGEFLLYFAINSRPRSSESKGKGLGIIILVILISLVFYILGFLGQIFAKIIQSAISRQKEFLADASSVQYTRNILGIKSALQRIKSLQNSGEFSSSVSKIQNFSAKPCAHMFFLNSISGFWSVIFATHPSLDSRIKALDKIS